MIKAAIIGGSGYTGSELARILCRHPAMTLEAITSRQNGGMKVCQVLPSLNGFVDLCFDSYLDENGDYDVVFCATPHGASMEIVPSLIERGIKVVDLSGDYRLGDPEIYEKWYGRAHVDLRGLNDAVYGLPEMFAEEIKKASLIANPGCYPTCSSLSLAPLLSAGLVDGYVIIDAKSGTSGAGQELSKLTHHPACGSSITPYKIGNHRHIPEIKMVLSRLYHDEVKTVFTPHLLPIVRGMLTTSYAQLKEGVTEEEIRKAYEQTYKASKFVRISALPSIPSTVSSNVCEVGFVVAPENTVVAIGALDNLVKGAAGQAVQNANLMFGLDESAGIDFPGLGV
ncbi:N-acetyl-gamma-glutamyl-phosphate reductase [Candidatus Methanomassiliicoccus intestinalis]|uniref:N-acetyl-gamma-glutamyl-phosphate reductase n=2 Tax=Candidatus Methanomassiliicoccus intestinalis TaxID=1406512 RepID=UPI0037DC95AC